MPRPVFKVYLAERSDGKCYVGCTKNMPSARIIETYHPLRWNGAEKAWPSAEIETSILFYTTSVEEAADYETAMIAEFRTLRPHGLNSRLESGYPGNLRARRREAA